MSQEFLSHRPGKTIGQVFSLVGKKIKKGGALETIARAVPPSGSFNLNMHEGNDSEDST